MSSAGNRQCAHITPVKLLALLIVAAFISAVGAKECFPGSAVCLGEIRRSSLASFRVACRKRSSRSLQHHLQRSVPVVPGVPARGLVILIGYLSGGELQHERPICV